MITRKRKFIHLPVYSPLLLAITMVFTINFHPLLAADPFRTLNGKNIGSNTQTGFELIFRQGDYPQGKEKLIRAEKNEPNEPLVSALLASLAYLDQDWPTLKIYADQTLKTATNLIIKDPLRGYLYSAVGHFLQGTYNFYQDGPISAIPKLQQVFDYLDKAEKTAPEDPELNLIKGYMDLLLATSLPFSNADQALQRLQNYGAPDYLVNRGIAIAYRDLKKYDQALEYVNKALKSTPNNPEIYYLKGQILYQKAKPDNRSLFRQSIDNFKEALKKADQLPESLVKQIKYELNNAENKLL
jgi:tetratricopeptide (TPR) repeat protein